MQIYSLDYIKIRNCNIPMVKMCPISSIHIIIYNQIKAHAGYVAHKHPINMTISA